MTFSPEAQAVWEGFAEADRESLLASTFCARCLTKQPFTLDSGEMRNGQLALIGHCKVCGARVVEIVS